MLGRSNCCAPQKNCYNNTYDDYEELSDKGGGRNGFNNCRPSFKENLCNRIKRVQESSKILENVLDIGSTLIKIMCVCGIHECKANKALDVIIYAFMHFDEVAEHPGGKCKKRIRKEEFYNDLMRDCGMTKAEAKLTYSIVKCAFKAFYHKQVINRYDAGFVDECEWKNAANRTINAFAQAGASNSEVEITGRRILCAYENYMCRLQSKKNGRDNQQDENKCVCNRNNRRSSAAQGGGFTSFGSQGFDPCKPPCPPPEPPLYGELCCQLVCPPGSTCPQIVCRDQCGRMFLRVDGNKVNFDPFIMESEAKRAAMAICPPNDADRIRALQECLNVCRPQDVDSCDEKLAEICKEAEKDDICDMDDVCDIGEDSSECRDDRDGDTDSDKRNQDSTNKRDSGDTKSMRDNDETKSMRERREKSRQDDDTRSRDTSKLKESPSQPSNRDRRKNQSNAGISITVKFEEERNGGRRMEVDMQGYCPDGGHAPDDIRTLTVKSNEDPPLEFSCTPLSDSSAQMDETRSVRSMKSTKTLVKAKTPMESEHTIKGEAPLASSTPRQSRQSKDEGNAGQGVIAVIEEEEEEEG